MSKQQPVIITDLNSAYQAIFNLQNRIMELEDRIDRLFDEYMVADKERRHLMNMLDGKAVF